MENLDVKDLETVVDTHDVDSNVAMMPKFLKEAYRVLGAKGGYCVFWYDIDHHEKLRDWALKVGFSVQRWPLVWNKASNCKNNSPQFNFTKATEIAMVCRRGSKTVLNSPQNKNFITCDGSLERKLYSNPFAKPAEAWKFILNAIAYQGQTILDPYAGQMSMARVALNLGLKPISIEISDFHFVRGVDNVKSILSDVTQNQVEFVNDPRAKGETDVQPTN
jgi:DNA modification methylase